MDAFQSCSGWNIENMCPLHDYMTPLVTTGGQSHKHHLGRQDIFRGLGRTPWVSGCRIRACPRSRDASGLAAEAHQLRLSGVNRGPKDVQVRKPPKSLPPAPSVSTKFQDPTVLDTCPCSFLYYVVSVVSKPTH